MWGKAQVRRVCSPKHSARNDGKSSTGGADNRGIIVHMMSSLGRLEYRWPPLPAIRAFEVAAQRFADWLRGVCRGLNQD